MATNRPGFLAELRRRNVLRAAVLYAGAAWALAQGISQLTPAIGLPDSAARWFLIVAVIGFPFWIAFAWLYELTPQGIRRESEVAAGESIAHRTARKLDVAIIGVLALAVVLLASGYFFRRQGPAGSPFAPPRNSLVVLPFRNLGGNSNQQYFSDGITEELTGALGQIPALRVIAWNTASDFRDVEQSASHVGRQLNVAYVLNGSILRHGDNVRVTAELANAANDYEVWSAHYDAPFKDIFKVQDQVTAAIARALAVKLATTDPSVGRTNDPRAHELVLRGRALEKKENAANLAQARDYFQHAVDLDPDYAEAHALLSRALLILTEHSSLPLTATLPEIRAQAQRALALDPRSADAWIAIGNAAGSADPPDFEQAREAYRNALALDPSNASAHIDYGIVLPLARQVAEYRRATLLDPANEIAWNNLAVAAVDMRDWELGVAANETLLKLDPADVDGVFGLAFTDQQLHREREAASVFDRARPSTPLDREQVDAGRLAYRAVLDPSLRPQALATLDRLAEKVSNTEVAGNLLQLYLALGENDAALGLLEQHCPAQPVGCNDLAVNPLYAPLRANPRFQKLSKTYSSGE